MLILKIVFNMHRQLILGQNKHHITCSNRKVYRLNLFVDKYITVMKNKCIKKRIYLLFNTTIQIKYTTHKL